MRKRQGGRPRFPSGLSMIEVMVVMAIIGMMMGLGAAILFPSDGAKVRQEASRLAGTIKFLYNEAAIKNKYYRLAMNLDENQYRVESSTEPFFVSMESEEDRKPTEKSGTAEGGPEEAAGGEGAPAPEGFAEESGPMTKPVKFPNGVRFRDITIMHSKQRLESGVVYAYFLPTGWAEPMVINLSDEDDENNYSLRVNPLTGKTKILGEYLEVDPEAFSGGEEIP